jgi:uncharacterized protein
MRKQWLCLIFLIWPFLILAGELPQPVGWVNDFAGVISPEYREKINARIQELEGKTGAEIAVATIDSISPYGEIEYARMLFDKWKPGKKGKDNGVLVLLAVKERRWRIETGYGVEGALPDGLCGRIGREYMVPYFKQGKYAEGLYYGTGAIVKILSGEAILIKAEQAEKKEISLFLIIFGVIFFSVWNIPWPIFIGLPLTLLFSAGFFANSFLAALSAATGYFIAMVIRYHIWRNMPLNKRPGLWRLYIFGLPRSASGRYSGSHSSWGGSWGSGGGGFGGGCGGGGGAGGGF